MDKNETVIKKSSSKACLSPIPENEETVHFQIGDGDSIEEEDTVEDMKMRLESNFLSRKRQSVISRNSIEVFFCNLPKTGTEFTNKEIKDTITDIIRSNIGIDKQKTLIENIRKLLLSHALNLFIIILVILDVMCVITQMILDFTAKRHESETNNANEHSFVKNSTEIENMHNQNMNIYYLEIVEKIFECVSACILSIFILIILFKAAFIPKEFFKSKLELFDSLIVTISFILEILSIADDNGIFKLEAAIITFRFWRIIRIVNAIVITVEKRLFEKLHNLKEHVKVVLEENTSMEGELLRKSHEIKKLNIELRLKIQHCDEIKVKFDNFISEHQNIITGKDLSDLDGLRSKLLEIKAQNTKINLDNHELRKKIEQLEYNLNKKQDENEKLSLIVSNNSKKSNGNAKYSKRKRVKEKMKTLV